MRPWFVAFCVTTTSMGCVPTARVMLPADAPVANVSAAPRAVAAAMIEAPASRDEGDEVFGEDAIRPCTDPGELRVARAALASVSGEIAQLDPGPGPKVGVVVDQLKSLLATTCFELASADLADPLVFDSGVSLQHWWNDGAGYAFFSSYLQDHIENVVITEEPRPTLFLDGHASSPLAPLLCAASDPSCGQSTAGWVRRAERRFSFNGQVPPEKDPCVESVASVEPETRWLELRSCRLSNAMRRSALPLGRFKAPTDGLFVTVYSSRCTYVSIYDVASGARMKAQDCGAPSGGPPNVEIGRVPLASLREAVWMTLLGGAADGRFRPSGVAAIPAGVTPGRPRENGGGQTVGLGSIGTHGRSAVWSWFRRDEQGNYVGQVSGAEWRGPSYDANDHAHELFEIADDAYDDSCAPPIPRSAISGITWSAPGPSLYELASDVSAVMSNPAVSALQRAVLARKTPPVCRTAL